MLVAGVDGCPGGWLILRVQVGERLRILGQPFVVAKFHEVVAETRACKAVGVDIPIGLSEHEYWRAADLEARLLLGRRASSVFPAPVRATLAATEYPYFRESRRIASQLSFEACGKKMTVYAHGILKKVREANEVMTPELQRYVVEVHPEVSFHAMSGGAITQSKKKPEGQGERRKALAEWFQGLTLDVPKRAGLDDFYDACAAAWTAARRARGEAERLPRDRLQVDCSRGLRMEIVY